MTNKLIVEFENAPSLNDSFKIVLSKFGVNTDYELTFTNDPEPLNGEVSINDDEKETYTNLAIALVKKTNFQLITSVQIEVDPYPFIDNYDLIYGAGYDNINDIGSIEYNEINEEVIFFEETTDGTPTPSNLWTPGGYLIIQPTGSTNRIILLITDYPIVDNVSGVGFYYRFPLKEIYSDFDLVKLDLYNVQYFPVIAPITKTQLHIEPIEGVRALSVLSSFELLVTEEPIIFENQLESLLRSSQFMFNPSTSVANYVKVRFIIKMLQNPAIGHRVIFIGRVIENGSTSFGVFGMDKTASSSTNDDYNFIRGANLADSLQNLYDSILLTYGPPLGPPLPTSIQITLNSADNEIYIDVTDVANLNTRTYDILVHIYNTNATFQPTVTTIPIGGFDTVKYGIKVWEGDRYDDEPTTNNYEKTKQKIIPSQIRTFIDFNQFCRDKMEFKVDKHVQNIPQVSNIPDNVGRWVKVTAQNFNLGQPAEIISRTYYATDGWLKDSELHVIPNILTTNLNRVISSTTKERVYFKTKNLNDISYTINGGTPIPVIFTADIDKTDEYIKSIALPPIDPTTKTISITFGYTNRIRVNFEINDSCFHKPVDLIYKNKWGVLETLSFNKVSVRKLEREGSQYQRSIVDMNGEFNPYRHTKKEYNVEGTESWTLNTNWVPQDLNSQFEDLMMSEEVYIRYIDEYTNSNLIKPVLVKTSSFDFKTKSVNRMINYTVEVELSHNKINNFL